MTSNQRGLHPDSGGGSMTMVLVVEQELLLMTLIREMLCQEKFEVEAVATDHAAMEVLASHQVDIMLINVGKDGDGFKLAEAALSVRPGLKLIFMTGGLEIVPEWVRARRVPFLTMPFGVDTLGKKIRDLYRTEPA